jgi:uncharacterized repeat protein (TIGR01451 family)
MIEKPNIISTAIKQAGLAVSGVLLGLFLLALLLATPGRANEPSLLLEKAMLGSPGQGIGTGGLPVEASPPAGQTNLLHSTLVSSHTLALTKTTATTTIYPGATIVYKLQYAVVGSEQALSVTVTDTVPAGVDYQDCWTKEGGILCEIMDGVVTWFLGDKLPPANGELGLEVAVKPSLPNDTEICNQAYVFDDGGERAVSNQVCHFVQSNHSLEISKRGPDDVIYPGEKVTYTLAYTVSGDEPAHSMTITDPLPTGTSFVHCASGGICVPSTGLVSWTLGTLTPTIDSAVTGVVTLVVQLDEGSAVGAQLVNTAYIQDEQGMRNQATETTDVFQGPFYIYLPVLLRRYPLPPPISSWHKGDLPAGVTVYSIASCTNPCTTLYAGTSDGVYRSENGGVNWMRTDLTGRMVRSVAVLRGDCSTVCAATWGGGLQVTDNGGDDWTPRNNGLGDLYLYAMTIHPDDDDILDDGDILYVGTVDAGVYKSTNGGSIWSAMNSGLPPGATVDALTIVPTTPGVVYAGTWGQGLYRTVDSGSSWSQVAVAGLRVYSVALGPDENSPVYVSTYENGVYRSQNGVDSWVHDGLAGQIVYSVAVGRDGMAYAGTTGTDTVHERPENGSWSSLASQPPGVSQVRSLTIGEEGCRAVLFAGTDSGAWWYGPD